MQFLDLEYFGVVAFPVEVVVQKHTYVYVHVIFAYLCSCVSTCVCVCINMCVRVYQHVCACVSTSIQVIAYLRIMRPGSIIGPQQQYLCAAASRLDNSSGARQSFDTAGIANSAALAKEVREGMLRQHVHHDETVAPAWNTPNGKNDSGRLGKGS